MIKLLLNLGREVEPHFSMVELEDFLEDLGDASAFEVSG
tara:strand:- start:138 stop:254 length:117 start_codon:yes stop_codon:yes gene_type:complete